MLGEFQSAVAAQPADADIAAVSGGAIAAAFEIPNQVALRPVDYRLGENHIADYRKIGHLCKHLNALGGPIRPPPGGAKEQIPTDEDAPVRVVEGMVFEGEFESGVVRAGDVDVFEDEVARNLEIGAA